MAQLTLTPEDFASAIMADMADDVTLEMMRPGDLTKNDMVTLVLRESGVRISTDAAIRRMKRLAEMQPQKYQYLQVRGPSSQVTCVLRVTLDGDEQC
jgi:hypothetical protein